MSVGPVRPRLLGEASTQLQPTSGFNSMHHIVYASIKQRRGAAIQPGEHLSRRRGGVVNDKVKHKTEEGHFAVRRRRPRRR